MKDPSLALERAARTAIEAKMAATYPSAKVLRNPAAGQAEPYLEYEGATVGPWDTKDKEGAETVQRFISWAQDPDKAQAAADLALQALTDRAAPITPAGHTVYISRGRAGGFDLELVDETTQRRYYGKPIVVRHLTHQT